MTAPKSNYVLLDTETSFCPGCRGRVDLLTEKEGLWESFYICWACKRVFQVAAGEVGRLD